MFDGPLSRYLFVPLLTLTAACSIPIDDSIPMPSPAASADEGAFEVANVSCMPTADDLAPAGIAPIDVVCPRGFTSRRVYAAEPISGRFSTLADLTAAFCIAKPAANAAELGAFAPKTDNDVDFGSSDVVVYAYDESNGEAPALYLRGSQLWVKTTSDRCSATKVASTLASVAFVVPKRAPVNEQICTRSCR